MSFLRTIESMKTVRDFKNDQVPPTMLKRLLNKTRMQKGLLPEATFSIQLVEDGTGFFQLLNGKAGYFGKMISAPHYIILFDEHGEGVYENSGYLMEQLRLSAWEENLGSCWISLDGPIDAAAWVDEPVETPPMALIAIGFPEHSLFKQDVLKKSGRLPLTDLVYLEKWGNMCPMDALEMRGLSEVLYYGKLAPSWGNRQPWRFILHQEKIYLTIQMDGQENRARTDAGIVMLYVQQAAHDKGLHMNWQLIPGEADVQPALALPETEQLIAVLG